MPPPPDPESVPEGNSSAAPATAPAMAESSSSEPPEESQPPAPEESRSAPAPEPLPPEDPEGPADPPESQPEPASQSSAASQPEQQEPPAPPEGGEEPEEDPPEEETPPPESAPDGGEEQPDPEGPPPAESTPPPEEEQGDPQGSRWMSISEATILTLINKERARLGVVPLTMDPDLAAAARVRAAELYRGNYVSHTRPDGSPWETVLQQDVPVEFALAAENLAWTNHAVGQDIAPFQWFQMWQQSESHYAAMVNDHYTHCGVAVLAGPYFDGEEQSYAVALFCSY